MTATDDEDGRFLPLADKIAEGTAVDPDEEQQRLSSDADRKVFDALLDIALIEAGHRSAERDFGLSQEDATEPPGRWAHLTILEKIGEGEFGEVYRAYDKKLQLDVALKLSTVDAGRLLDTPRLLEEARLMARVRHENVVRVYGADHKDGRVGLWMDLVQGQTLEELARARGFGASEATDVGIKLCRALAAVHAVGVLHGDIKARNVIREDRSGRIVLVDFGAGRAIAADPGKGNDLAGTPVHMAPEVLDGQPRSAASDIYSLGVLLFHLVTGDYPVYASSRSALIEAHRTNARKRLRDLRPDLSERFIAVVERATATEPKARYASAGALETDLLHLLAPPVGVAPGSSQVRDWRLWTGAATAGILSIGAFTVWITSQAAVSTVVAERANGAPVVSTAVMAQPDSYDIEATFYRLNGASGRELLRAGQSVKVSDELSLSVTTSAPTYLYVVNEDDRGEAYLLFPLPGQSVTNPLPAGREVRVPADYNWQVSSTGGQEHFVVLGSRERLSAFEEVFRSLPPPRLGVPLRSQPLPDEAIEQFRGVGGLTPTQPTQPERLTPAAGFRALFTEPLKGRETVTGFWARQLTLDNAGTTP